MSWNKVLNSGGSKKKMLVEVLNVPGKGLGKGAAGGAGWKSLLFLTLQRGLWPHLP